MKSIRHRLFDVLVCGFVVRAASLASQPEQFGTKQIEDIWMEVWKSGGSKTKAPKIETLSEQSVIKGMSGKWTVLFGVIPDKLAILLNTNRTVEVTGQKDGAAWIKTGQWRVVSNKLVLFLKEDDIPGFIFRTKDHAYIFDPWAKSMMSELTREK